MASTKVIKVLKDSRFLTSPITLTLNAKRGTPTGVPLLCICNINYFFAAAFFIAFSIAFSAATFAASSFF